MIHNKRAIFQVYMLRYLLKVRRYKVIGKLSRGSSKVQESRYLQICTCHTTESSKTLVQCRTSVADASPTLSCSGCCSIPVKCKFTSTLLSFIWNLSDKAAWLESRLRGHVSTYHPSTGGGGGGGGGLVVERWYMRRYKSPHVIKETLNPCGRQSGESWSILSSLPAGNYWYAHTAYA